MNIKNTYWHFRRSLSAGGEDTSGDSIMLDISRIKGMTMGANDGSSNARLSINFEKSGNTQSLHEQRVTTNGMIVLDITPGKQKDVMRHLAELSNPANNKKSYVTIADDLNKEYASRYITSVYRVINT